MFEQKSKELDRKLILLDVIVTVAAFFGAYFLRGGLVYDNSHDLFSHASLLPMVLALELFFLTYFGAYRSPRRSSFGHYCWSVFKSVTLMISGVLGFLFVMKINYVSRLVICNFAAFLFVFLLAVRYFTLIYFRNSVMKGLNLHKVLIIGTGNRAIQLSRMLRKNMEWGVDIIGYLDPQQDRVGTQLLGRPVFGTVEDISRVLKKHVIDEVIIAIPRKMIGDVEPIARSCEEEGIKLRIMADLYDLQVARVSLLEMDGIPLISLEPVAMDENKLILKRIIDLAAVILAIPIMLPVLAVIAIAIKLDSPGPVFFVQERVGLRKRRFNMIKFRSMYVGSEQKLKELEHLNEAQGPIFKISNDPRVTRVGRFIRKTSLDELPQLFNVLAGHMSLVGPRPMSIRDVELFDRGIQRKRFSVKPGLTCIWQISGRSNLPFSKWLELDLKYIENWSLFLDLKILFRTIPAVFRGSGAM